MTSATARTLVKHLKRDDEQEDLCFALWRPSTGRDRETALVSHPILPREGDRHVHGNASFESQYFERALATAIEREAGLALLHAHPEGRGWQEMSDDDCRAERGHAAQTRAGTGLPLLGLTLATADTGWSARRWQKTAPKTYVRTDCESVRVVGDRLALTFDERQRPRPAFRAELTRTRSAWGDDVQANLARLRVGVVGLGSVGALVAEAIARTGIANIRLIDFDAIERVNLDRIIYARRRDARLRRAKVAVAARALAGSATAAAPRVEPLELSIVERSGYVAALDCDVLFSCVDRPWPRYALNLIAYAHLIPVVDGGIFVDVTKSGRMRGADWKAHVAAPGRRCLECLGQYDAGLVEAERAGDFDDPEYIRRLPDDHPIKRNENVFAFGLGCAALETGQLVSMVAAPSGVADFGAQNYHAKTGEVDLDVRDCERGCFFTNRLIALGDRCGFDPTSRHPTADDARAARRAFGRRPMVRTARLIDDLATRLAR